jgi:sortase A
LWLERALLTGGVACAAWVGFVTLGEGAYQRASLNSAAAFPAEVRDHFSADTDKKESMPLHGAIGVLTIPRLNFSAAVAEGDDDGTLRVAIGHLPDTPLPWADGNSAFAGHRDTHFRALRAIQTGDRIDLKTPRGIFRYVVDDRSIVSPDDLSVLKSTGERSMTLITCYPFSYIGRAPQRFIVHATQTGRD